MLFFDSGGLRLTLTAISTLEEQLSSARALLNVSHRSDVRLFVSDLGFCLTSDDGKEVTEFHWEPKRYPSSTGTENPSSESTKPLPMSSEKQALEEIKEDIEYLKTGVQELFDRQRRRK